MYRSLCPRHLCLRNKSLCLSIKPRLLDYHLAILHAGAYTHKHIGLAMGSNSVLLENYSFTIKSTLDKNSYYLGLAMHRITGLQD